MEQIRLIKELRDADIQRGRTSVFIRPRFMLCENVPGAFSSNHRNDFRAVLEETIRIAELDAPHTKYALSAKACAGIVRRAEQRGKKLPPELKTMLAAQMDTVQTPTNASVRNVPLYATHEETVTEKLSAH